MLLKICEFMLLWDEIILFLKKHLTNYKKRCIIAIAFERTKLNMAV